MPSMTLWLDTQSRLLKAGATGNVTGRNVASLTNEQKDL